MEIKKVSYKELFEQENIDKILDSFKNTGFLVLSDTGIKTNGLFQTWSLFFNQLEKDKLKYKYNNKSLRQSGYFPFKSETAKDNDKADLKEFYQVYNLEDLPDISYYNTFLLKIKLNKIAIDLLTIIDHDLKSKGELAEAGAHMSLNMTRIIHYPLLKNLTDGVRAAEHEDINLITLLPASNYPGLQVKSNSNTWYDVVTENGDLVVNIGDMLQMYSNSEYKSTTHRVINLPGKRISFPFFVHPPSSFDLGDKTAGEYLEERLKEIGVKNG